MLKFLRILLVFVGLVEGLSMASQGFRVFWVLGILLGGWVGTEPGYAARSTGQGKATPATGAQVRFKQPTKKPSQKSPSPSKKPGAKQGTVARNVLFQTMCGQRGKLSAESRHTMEVLLRVAGTTQCDRAAQGLAKQKVLDLSGTGIRDLRPVGTLTTLETLVLSRNPIENWSPLAGLVNLKTLVIRDSVVKELGAIASLPKLTSLILDGVGLTDITPLARLQGLQTLSLQYNQIQDISAFAALKNVTSLALQGNRVRDLSPLTLMTYLRELRLDGNLVENVRPLAGLIGLEVLTLNNTLLTEAGAKDLLPLVGLKRLELLGIPMKQNPCPTLRSGAVCAYHQLPTVSGDQTTSGN